ncbi:OLC1v1005362C1, partial [Oldenlandia corymbosa var. corymbosa]
EQIEWKLCDVKISMPLRIIPRNDDHYIIMVLHNLNITKIVYLASDDINDDRRLKPKLGVLKSSRRSNTIAMLNSCRPQMPANNQAVSKASNTSSRKTKPTTMLTGLHRHVHCKGAHLSIVVIIFRWAFSIFGSKAHIRILVWSPPPRGYTAENTYGTVKPNKKQTITGGVIRDHEGRWLGGFMQNIEICTPVVAELWGA